MPRLTVAYPKSKRGTGQGERGGRDWARRWMEEVKEDGEGEAAQRQRLQSTSNQTPTVHLPQQTLWSQIQGTLESLEGWSSFAVAAVVWSVVQVAVPLLPSAFLVDVCWRLLLVCLMWIVLGGCVYALKSCLRPGQNQFKGGPPLRIQQDIVTEDRQKQFSRTPRSRSPGDDVLLALALADSLLLCILQEPLSDPSLSHIKSLLSRLESVSQTLEKAEAGSERTVDEPDRDSLLSDKVKLISNYLNQRMRSLRRLVQVQGDFEASVKDVLQGLDGLWAQLEELHTGVTLTKEGSRGHRGLASARTDAEFLFAVLGHYRNRLRCCEAHLKDSTQLLQELTWSHTHIGNSVSSSSEAVWPELLLQSNIEQFDKVQESFLSLEQQTSTFQAHLEGLGKGDQEGLAGPLAQANRAHSCSASPQTSPHLNNGRTNVVSLERRNSSPVSSPVTEEESDTRLSLRERSALQLSSTFGRLRKSGKRK